MGGRVSRPNNARSTQTQTSAQNSRTQIRQNNGSVGRMRSNATIISQTSTIFPLPADAITTNPYRKNDESRRSLKTTTPTHHHYHKNTSSKNSNHRNSTTNHSNHSNNTNNSDYNNNDSSPCDCDHKSDCGCISKLPPTIFPIPSSATMLGTRSSSYVLKNSKMSTTNLACNEETRECQFEKQKACPLGKTKCDRKRDRDRDNDPVQDHEIERKRVRGEHQQSDSDNKCFCSYQPLETYATKSETPQHTRQSKASQVQICSSSRGGIDPEQFQEDCLMEHNRLRAIHNSPALVISEKLTKLASEWAEHLARSNSYAFNACNKYGENIYFAINIQNVNGADVTKSWYNEILRYDFGHHGFTPCTGHFTQLVWRNSKKLGVGIAVRGNKTWVVAYYNPPGNIIEGFEENVRCPIQSSSDSEC